MACEILLIALQILFWLVLKRDTAIQRYSDTGTGTGTELAHNLCKLSHFITAGDINDNIFQGESSRENSEKYMGIRQTRKNGIRDALNSLLIYLLSYPNV